MIVSRPIPYDDSKSRNAFQRYADAHGLILQLNDQKAEFDAFVRTPKGKHIAVEFQCNSCWTTEAEYPQDIHIPARKFPYFRDIIYPPDGTTLTAADDGYFILFNVAHTKAAMIKFSALLNGFFEQTQMHLNGENCPVVMVPTTYIYKYIEIPE